MYTVVILEEVFEELHEITLYYESKIADLSLKFLNDWETTIHRLQINPFIYQKFRKNFRIVNLDKFPYRFIFELEDDTIIIYRITHAKRNPKQLKIKK